MVLRVTLDIPDVKLEEIERLRKQTRDFENLEERKHGDTLEAFILYLVDMGIGEW